MGSPWGCVCRSCFASSIGASIQYSMSCLCGDHLFHLLWATHHPVRQLGASVADERWLISDSLVTHTQTLEKAENCSDSSAKQRHLPPTLIPWHCFLPGTQCTVILPCLRSHPSSLQTHPSPPSSNLCFLY